MCGHPLPSTTCWWATTQSEWRNAGPNRSTKPCANTGARPTPWPWTGPIPSWSGRSTAWAAAWSTESPSSSTRKQSSQRRRSRRSAPRFAPASRVFSPSTSSSRRACANPKPWVTSSARASPEAASTRKRVCSARAHGRIPGSRRPRTASCNQETCCPSTPTSSARWASTTTSRGAGPLAIAD